MISSSEQTRPNNTVGTIGQQRNGRPAKECFSPQAHLCICQLCTCGEHKCKNDNFKVTKTQAEQTATDKQLVGTRDNPLKSSLSSSCSSSASSSCSSSGSVSSDDNDDEKNKQLEESVGRLNLADHGDHESIDVDYEDDARSLSLPMHDSALDDDGFNGRRILICKQSNKQHQNHNCLSYLLTKQPENRGHLGKNATDIVVAGGDLNLEGTFDANYENLAKKRLAKWTQDDTAGTDNVTHLATSDTQQRDNKTDDTNNNNNNDNVPRLASNDDRCCYMHVYDKNLNRLEMVVGRKRSKHRPSTSLRPGYSGFFGPTEEVTATTHQQQQKQNHQHQHQQQQQQQHAEAPVKQTVGNRSEHVETRVAKTKKDFSPLFHNEYSINDFKCDRAIENDIKYKHQQPRAHNETDQLDRTGDNDGSRLTRKNHPDCTCGSHFLLDDNTETWAKERTHTQINENVSGANNRKKHSRKRRKKVKSKRSHQDDKQQQQSEQPDDVEDSVLTRKHKHSVGKLKELNLQQEGAREDTMMLPAAISNNNNSSKVLDVRNLKSSDSETYLTFPGENRRLPLKRKVKNNPNLIDHIQQNDIINETHRQQKRHPIDGSLLNTECSPKPEVPSVVTKLGDYTIKDIDENNEVLDSSDESEDEELQNQREYDNLSAARPSRQEANIRRNTIRSDEYEDIKQKQKHQQYRSKSTVAKTRNSLQQPFQGQQPHNQQQQLQHLHANDNTKEVPKLTPVDNKPNRVNNRMSKSTFISENKDATIETVAHSQKTRDKLHKTCQQQHFSIFDNDYPQPKDFDDLSSPNYKRWPSRNSHEDASPKEDHRHLATNNGMALANKTQRIKSYNDLFRQSPDSVFTFGDKCDYGTSYKSLCVGVNNPLQCPVYKLKDRFDYVGENLGHRFYVKK